MDLDELIQRLEELRDEFGGRTPVRGVFQPHYPLLADIDAVTMVATGVDLDHAVFIGLADGREYGSSMHYADDVVLADDDEWED